MTMDLETPMSFFDFPDDVQLNILSFLYPLELSAFACTCRRFASLCSLSSPSADLWLSLCDRRWGSKTQLRQWSAIPSPRLYQTLDRWENLIGFWRRIGRNIHGTPPLVFFEWSSSCIIGSRILPSAFACSYAVRKTPFLWLGLSVSGDALIYLHQAGIDVIPATISFTGFNHFVVEESLSFFMDPQCSEEIPGLEPGSPPDRVMAEIYQYFANKTSPGADKILRRQKKKKEKERVGWRRKDDEHFVKIWNYCPTPERPLQGLWKGISENMNLEFYLLTHDDVGGIACRRVGDTDTLLFWTPNTTFLEPPFSKEEQTLYSLREHIGSVDSVQCNMDRQIVSRILCINSSYDLVLPELAGCSGDPRDVEGRIWEYEDGTFGFGFFRNKSIVDLKNVTQDGYILDAIECCDQAFPPWLSFRRRSLAASPPFLLVTMIEPSIPIKKS